MSALSTVCVLCALLAYSPAGAAAEVVARALGAELTTTELEAAGDEPARLARLRDWVWSRVYAHYIAEHGLAATAADIEELVAYNREFDRRDRLQRARKLEELNGRLAADDLSVDERAWLEEFRSVLTRMANREARNDGSAPDGDSEPGLYVPWIEFWKGNRALYAEYGGTVALTSAGPAAHGAWLALIADYERRGQVHFPEPRLRAQLFELMSRPPHIIVPPDRVDFTPYWRQPIPPSYIPD